MIFVLPKMSKLLAIWLQVQQFSIGQIKTPLFGKKIFGGGCRNK
jgi:hypothetical protein